MQMKIKLKSHAIMPTRAHLWDSGLDLKAPKEALIAPGSFIKIDTGVQIQIPMGCVGFIKSRRDLMERGIKSDGIVNAGDSSPITVYLFNAGNQIVRIKRLDEIAQLIITSCELPGLEKVVSFLWPETGERV